MAQEARQCWGFVLKLSYNEPSPRAKNLITRITQTRNDVANVIQVTINGGGENVYIGMCGIKPRDAFRCGNQHQPANVRSEERRVGKEC